MLHSRHGLQRLRQRSTPDVSASVPSTPALASPNFAATVVLAASAEAATASFAFDERKMWNVDPSDLTALKKHAGQPGAACHVRVWHVTRDTGKTDHCNICGHCACDSVCGSCGSQFHTACETAANVGTDFCLYLLLMLEPIFAYICC